MAVSPDGTQVAVTLRDRTVRVLDVETQKEDARFDCPPARNGVIGRVEYSPNGTTLAAHNGALCVWDLRSRTQVFRLAERVQDYQGFEHAFAYLDDHRLLVCSGRRLRVVAIPSGEELLTVPGFGGEVHGLRVLPGDRVVGLCDGVYSDRPRPTLRVWETKDWAELLRLNVGEAATMVPQELVVSGDGRRMAVRTGSSIACWMALTRRTRRSSHPIPETGSDDCRTATPSPRRPTCIGVTNPRSRGTRKRL